MRRRILGSAAGPLLLWGVSPADAAPASLPDLTGPLEWLRGLAAEWAWPWGAAAAAAAAAWILLGALWRSGAGEGSGQRLSPAGLRRAARRASRRKDHLVAAALYERAQDLPAAAQAYERGQAHREAAGLWDRLGQPGRAARLYESAGQPVRAAELCLKLGNVGRAALLFQRGGDDHRAAECFERAGELERAAGLFERLEAFERAGAIRQRLNQPAAAAELLERHLDRLRGRPEAPRQPEVARRAAALYQKAEAHARAARLLAAEGLEAEAGEAYCLAGEWERGLEILQRQGQHERAAALCRTHGQAEWLQTVTAEGLAAAGRELEAAEAFEAAGLWWRAGELFERGGEPLRAAAMYARQGDEERAADLYVAGQEPAEAARALERFGRWSEAARQYQASGDVAAAARMLERAGDLYGAAQMQLQLPAVEEAVLLLQRVGADSPDHYRATVALGDLFLQRGLDGPAREKFERAVSLAGSSQELVHPTYRLGEILEREGRVAEALLRFEKVLAERFDYREVQAKVSALRQRLAETVSLTGGQATTRGITGEIGGGAAPRYRMVRELGRGGMGIVYQAEDTVLERTVAFKVLPDAIRDDPKALDYFLREARIAASLQHPNIVTIFDAGQAAGVVYIAMEFVEGRSVQELLDEVGHPPLSQALEIFRQACRSLAYAHQRQVVHRDVKPGNMMLTRQGVVKLMDFGLAAVVTQATQQVTTIRGTPFYMAPEQIRGENVSSLADQYALGCTLYHLVTGRPPFVEGDILYHHMHSPPAAPRSWNRQIPVWLDAIILRSMAKPPGERFASVGALLGEVESCLNSVRSGPIAEGPAAAGP